MSHAHFTPELFSFLTDLKANNNREWFQRHRERYDTQVREPLLRFVADMAEPLREISSCLVADPRPSGGSMFRIYRDVRFSRDKSPYKTHAAVQFRHQAGKDVHAPGLYLHLEPGNVLAGTGVWRPDGPALLRIRTAIAEDPAGWLAARNAPELVASHRLGGEALKRPPRGFDADHPLIDDLKRKDFVTLAPLSEELVLRPDFMERYLAICRAAAGFMRFLSQALGHPW